MQFFRSWSRNRIAKRYARELPRRLKQAYGASERYTPAQIRTAVSSLGLDANFIALAYVSFLAEEEFDALQFEMSEPISYADGRAMIARYRPHGLTSASGEPFDGMPGGIGSAGSDGGSHGS
jgi:hypothetical protein